MSSLSIVINTKNAADTLAAALESCAFAQEIIVADMASTDDTLEIAKQFSVKVVRVKEYGRVEPEARNEAFGAATADWIFQLDADESLPASLQQEITRLVTESDPEVTAYAFPRQNQIFGYLMQHTGWWPDYQVRLFRRGKAKYSQGVHSTLSVSGDTKTLPAKETLSIQHRNYQTVEQYIERLNRYTSLAATEKLDAQSDTAFLSTFSDEFFRRFFDQEGYKDGDMGMLLSLLQSFYQVTTHAKRVTADKATNLSDTSAAQQAQLQSLTQFQKDLAYWMAQTHEREATTTIAAYWWKLRKKMRI